MLLVVAIYSNYLYRPNFFSWIIDGMDKVHVPLFDFMFYCMEQGMYRH